jgi:Glycosyl transferase family 2
MNDLGISVVMPCLNEAETLASCIAKARRGLVDLGMSGEIVVADNGSTDGSTTIARRLGARVVDVRERGYGSALRAGIAEARGRYVVMGDADDSYDFSELAPFVGALERGADLVMGNRFKGRILPRAMPWKHRWIGNPLLSGLGRLFFRSPVGDFHCGLRAFRKDAYDRLDLTTTGMEFASEMVIKSTLEDLRIAEVPITLHPDGRSRPPHLRSYRDGWRHLRFMLLLSPLWLFLVPGAALTLLGALGVVVLAIGPAHVGRLEIDVHTMLVSAMLCLVGVSVLVFGVLTKTLAVQVGLHPREPLLERLRGVLPLEVGAGLGALACVAGLGLLASATAAWGHAGFGALSPSSTMRLVIPAVLLVCLGLQAFFASFLFGFLRLAKGKAA